MDVRFKNSTVLLQRILLGIFLLLLPGCGEQRSSPRSSVNARHNEPEITDARLIGELKKATRGAPNNRCRALEWMSEYWSVNRVQPAGFSDLPVEVKQPETRQIPDSELEAIATVLQSALTHANHDVRKEAAICLCNAPRQSPAVDAAVAVALNSKDSTVLWYLHQLRIDDYQWPDPEPYVKNLIGHLTSPGDAYAVTAIVECFGEKFVPHTKTVIEKLPDIPQDNRWLVLLTLSDIGLSSDAADLLMTRIQNESPEAKAAAFVALLKFPAKATRFLQEQRGLGKMIEEMQGRVCDVLHSSAPDLMELREELIATPDVGPVILALIGSSRSIPDLTRQLDAASEHRKTLLFACIRACGGELGEVVSLSKANPIVFKPKSAWPGTDARRTSNEPGHGDGFTDILVTGEMKRADGGHPAEVRFFRMNDGMLLGEARRDAIPLKYDPTSGRFVFLTDIFAAYAMGKPPEPGPYQTGSAQILIEATGCSPLTIQFFDEMPHVVIELPD
jgi:hypothetical protein